MPNPIRSKQRTIEKLLGWDDIRKPSIACEKAWAACLRAKEHRYQSLKSRELLLQLYRALQQKMRGWKSLEAEQRGMEDLARQVEQLGLSTTVLPCRTGKEKVVIFRALFRGLCSGIRTLRAVSKKLNLPEVSTPRAAGVMPEVVVNPMYSLSWHHLLREREIVSTGDELFPDFKHTYVRNGNAKVFPVIFTGDVMLHEVDDWAELIQAKLADPWCLLAYAQTTEGKRLKQSVYTQYWPEGIIRPFLFSVNVQDAKLYVAVDECSIVSRIPDVMSLFTSQKPRHFRRTYTPKTFPPGTVFLLQTKN